MRYSSQVLGSLIFLLYRKCLASTTVINHSTNVIELMEMRHPHKAIPSDLRDLGLEQCQHVARVTGQHLEREPKILLSG